ncbi:MAG: hypothetical protein ACRC33_22655 [Gemmataceae bacterium]
MPAARTPFFASPSQGGGLLIANLTFFPNNVFFVDSTSSNKGDSSGRGLSPDAPFATLDYAVGQCSANEGDVIFAMPGHVETVTAAAGLDLDVAGIRIIGLGQGRNRPAVTFTTATTADLDVDADNITVENVYFNLTGFDALAAPLDVNAAGFTLRDCEFNTGDATNQAVLAILTDANASRLTVEGCIFRGTADAGTAACIRIVGGDGHVIRNNFFSGAYTTSLGAIDNVTTACTNALVEDNSINNLTASSTKAMVFVAASTGQIRRNTMQILSGTAPITGAAMSWVGQNYYAATIATAGTLI